MEKYRELNFLRCKRVLEFGFLREDQVLRGPLTVLALLDCLGMYDWSLAGKIFLHTFVSRRHGRGKSGLLGAGPSRVKGVAAQEPGYRKY